MPPVCSQTPERPRRTRKDSLTLRQLEVEALILRGLMDKQIASRLRLSEATVKQHARTVYRFRGVESRTEMMARRIAELEALAGERGGG